MLFRSNPISPVYLGEWDDEYIHDGMVIVAVGLIMDVMELLVVLNIPMLVDILQYG